MTTLTPHSRSKGRRAFLLLIAAALILVACGGAPAEEPTPPLAVGWSLFPGWYPMAIAIEGGYFAAQGVDVAPQFYAIYEDTLADLISEKLDAALVPLSDAILLDSHMPGSMRVVLATDNSVGADAIVAPAEIRSVTDLRGRRIGAQLGSFGELLILSMLQENGLNTGDVSLVNVAPETVPEAIPQTIQAGHVWEPFLSESLERGLHVLYTSASTPGLIPDVLVVRADVLDERPEDIRAFIRAWFAAQDFWSAHPAEAGAMISAGTGLPEGEILTDGILLFGLEENRNTFENRSDLTSLYGSGKVTIDFLVTSGVITVAPELELLLDSSFLPAPTMTQAPSNDALEANHE